MIKRIIILILSPFNKRDFHRFGVQILRDRGFIVDIWNVMSIAFVPGAVTNAPLDACTDEKLTHFNTKQQVLEHIAMIDANTTLIIDHLVLNRKTAFIYKALGNIKAHYLRTYTGCLPSHPTSKLHKLRQYKLHRLPEFLMNKFISHFLRDRLLSKLHAYYLLGGSKAARLYGIKIKESPANFIQGHAYDYDKVLEDNSLPSIENYAVFVDIYAPYHPDFKMFNIKSINDDLYYGKLREYLNYFEKKYKLPVKIAAHPESNYRDKPTVFGNREIIFGNTQALIKKSNIVLIHGSTSINYAVLYKKPMVFLIFKNCSFVALKAAPINMCRSVGCRSLVALDDKSTYDKLTQDIFSIDQEKYQLYKQDYIKTEGSPEKNNWEIVADYFSRELKTDKRY